MTKLQGKLLVLEGRTKMAGIPFCDRFYVVDRWIIESRKMSDEKGENSEYKSELSVFLEIKFTESCQFEAQVRKKTLSTMTDMVDAWCKQATAALALAEKQRIKRENFSKFNESNGNVTSNKQYVPGADANKKNFIKERPKHEFDTNEELLGLHKNKLNDIEKKIVAGEMNDLGIEVFVLETDQTENPNNEKNDFSLTSLVRSEKQQTSINAATMTKKGKRKTMFAKLKRTKPSTA